MVSFITDFRRFENSLNPIVHQICIWYYYTQVNFLPTTFRLRYHENVILKHRNKVKINNVAQMNISHDFVWVSSLVSFSCKNKKLIFQMNNLRFTLRICWFFFVGTEIIPISNFSCEWMQSALKLSYWQLIPIVSLQLIHCFVYMHFLFTVWQRYASHFDQKTKLVSHFIRCNFT